MPVYGKAGTGLSGDISWAKNENVARIGAAGEAKTEALLNDLAAKYPSLTVMHDIKVPGSKGNVDHLVIAGTTVLLVDTKVWKPGFLWTMGGTTRRGWDHFKSCDSDFFGVTARDRIAGLLPNPTMLTPMVLVWPSSAKGKVSTWAAKMPGAKLASANSVKSVVARLGRSRREADPDFVETLRKILAR